MYYYNDNRGEYDWAHETFSHTRGYDPEIIAEAPHYMDYDALYSCSILGNGKILP